MVTHDTTHEPTYHSLLSRILQSRLSFTAFSILSFYTEWLLHPNEFCFHFYCSSSSSILYSRILFQSINFTHCSREGIVSAVSRITPWLNRLLLICSEIMVFHGTHYLTFTCLPFLFDVVLIWYIVRTRKICFTCFNLQHFLI